MKASGPGRRALEVVQQVNAGQPHSPRWGSEPGSRIATGMPTASASASSTRHPAPTVLSGAPKTTTPDNSARSTGQRSRHSALVAHPQRSGSTTSACGKSSTRRATWSAAHGVP